MSAEQEFRDGRLDEAIAAQTETLRSSPLDADARWQLFVLLCFAGELERAEKQLDVLSTREDGASKGGLVYRSLLSSDFERRQVFAGVGSPVLPPDAPDYAKLRIDALHQSIAGDGAGAAKTVEAAIAATPDIQGTVDGVAIDGICDLDDRFGAMLEVYAGARYLWFPLSMLRSLTLEPAATAIDALWRPAELVDANGESAQVFLPALYPGSSESADPAIRLGRDTETSVRDELEIALGQHRLLVAEGDELREVPLLGLRSLELGP